MHVVHIDTEAILYVNCWKTGVGGGGGGGAEGNEVAILGKEGKSAWTRVRLVLPPSIMGIHACMGVKLCVPVAYLPWL